MPTAGVCLSPTSGCSRLAKVLWHGFGVLELTALVGCGPGMQTHDKPDVTERTPQAVLIADLLDDVLDVISLRVVLAASALRIGCRMADSLLDWEVLT